MQRLQGRELYRAGVAGPQDGQAHLSGDREDERARPHSRHRQASQPAPQHRHPHQVGLVGQRQVGGQRRRRQQVRPHVERVAGGVGDAYGQRVGRLSETHSLPHRQSGDQHTPHQDRHTRSVAVLCADAQDGFPRRFHRCGRRFGRRLRRHPLGQQREQRELLDAGV